MDQKEQKICAKHTQNAVFMLLGIVFFAGTVVGCKKQEAKPEVMKVGMALQDLNNPVWAARSVALEKLITGDGGQITVVDCKNNATTQISQIENFMASGINVLMIHPAEKNAIDAALKAVRDKGIKVFCYDDDIVNADVCFLVDNYKAGYMIGEQAANWINEKFDGSCEVAVLNYPQIQILLERGNGIVDAIKTIAPNARIVAESSAINTTEGMAKTETFLQAHSNIKVVASIGGGGAVGANEAVKAGGKLTPDFGIFASDATPEELDAIAKDEAIRMSIMYTGTPEQSAEIVYGWISKLYKGEPIDKKVYHTFIPVTKDNYREYL
jgi:ribose transport system substrate-binding protein